MSDDYSPTPLGELIDLMEEGDSGTKESRGEDGGFMINCLEELTFHTPEVIKETVTKYLGKTRFFNEMVGDSHKTLRIFENDQYRFICLEDIEVNPGAGGTCPWGEVQLYLNPKRIERECPMCGQTFVAQRNTKEVCSDRCRQRKKRAGAKTQEKEA